MIIPATHELLANWKNTVIVQEQEVNLLGKDEDYPERYLVFLAGGEWPDMMETSYIGNEFEIRSCELEEITVRINDND